MRSIQWKIKITKLATNKILDTVEQKAIKNEEKNSKITNVCLKFFNDKIIFVDDCFHKMFAYEPTFDMSDYKQVGSEYIVSNRKSNGIYTTNFVALHNLAPIIGFQF